LKDLSPTVMGQLKSLGFQVKQDRPRQKAVIGRFAMDKLTELAKIESIKFVAFVAP
jgi:hypothetical protein